ncbi:SCO family protein [Roseovarius sp. EL26]|uniref:SCO family protein n=1 Tax=Roseovarius sp. EL26 TaxID=2126672 RepID=UPI000EA267EF|nr:SCO family protein [Roseovarius sp. EL26]
MARMVAVIAGVAAVGLLGVTYYVSSQSGSNDQFAQCRGSQIAGGAGQIGGSFTLVDGTGATVTDKEVIDKPALIYFGYTFCPDVCPVDSARNAAAADILKQRGENIKPVMITVDPARDTPEVMKEYTEYMHPNMQGLTGSEEQVRAAAKAYRVFYQKQPSEDGDEDFYLMDHTTMSYLTLPEYGFVEFFQRVLTPEQVADRVACFLDAV